MKESRSCLINISLKQCVCKLQNTNLKLYYLCGSTITVIQLVEGQPSITNNTLKALRVLIF